MNEVRDITLSVCGDLALVSYEHKVLVRREDPRDCVAQR